MKLPFPGCLPFPSLQFKRLCSSSELATPILMAGAAIQNNSGNQAVRQLSNSSSRYTSKQTSSQLVMQSCHHLYLYSRQLQYILIICRKSYNKTKSPFPLSTTRWRFKELSTTPDERLLLLLISFLSPVVEAETAAVCMCAVCRATVATK